MCGGFILFWILVLFVSVAEILAVPDTISKIKFTLKLHKNKLNCDENEEYGYTVTVLEEQPMHLIINYTHFLDSIRCHPKHDNKNKYVDENNKLSPASILINPVHKEMSGFWKCTILTNRKTKNIEPVVTESDVKYAAAYCFVKVNIRLKESPQTVLVNNLILKQTPAPYDEKRYDYSVEYKYLNNSEVDVYCFQKTGNNKCTVELNFDQVQKIYKATYIVDTKFSSSNGVKAYIVLQYIHNYHHVDCIRKCDEDVQTVRITFISDNKVSNDIQLKVNNRYIRIDALYYTQPNNPLNFVFFNNDLMNIACEGNKLYCTNTCGQSTGCNISFSNVTNRCNFQCSLHLMRTIKGDITIIENILVATSQLLLSYSKNNTIMDIYADGIRPNNRLVYYEFDKHEHNVTITCSICNSDGLVFSITTDNENNTEIVSENLRSVTATLTLPQNEPFKFYLKETVDMHVDIQEMITLVFVRKIQMDNEQQTSTKYTDSSTTATSLIRDIANKQETLSQETQIYIGIGVGMIIVIICVAVMLYKLRKRNESQSMVAINEEMYSEPRESQHPPQWTEDIYERSEYSVPFGQPDTYAVPTPKNLRHLNRGDQNSDVYAEVYQKGSDISPYAEVSKRSLGQDSEISPYAEIGNPEITPYAQVSKRPEMEQQTYADVKELYSQVQPKFLRKKNSQTTYANCYPDSAYENAERTEYVEPTYTENLRK